MARQQEDGTHFSNVVAIVRQLRAPGGCPWDRRQTHASLCRYAIEEAREVVEAVRAGDPHALAEELGDLLLQVLLHAVIAEEEGSFTLAEILDGLAAKLIRRHPHVFSREPGARDLTPEEVAERWKATKAMERPMAQDAWLNAVRRDLPVLVEAQQLGQRAAEVGFDWSAPEEAWPKVEEEMAEFRTAWCAGEPTAVLEEELGDLLFSLVSVGRLLGMDLEAVMLGANQKFRRRFTAMEVETRRQGRELAGVEQEEMDQLWRLVKANESSA